MDANMGTSNEPNASQKWSLSRLSSDVCDDVFETSELQDDVFLPLNNNIKTSRTRHNRRSELVKRSSSDFSDADLFETTNLDMLSTPSPNGETRHPLRDMSSPTSIASRSSTATFPGSRTGTPMMDQTLSAAFRDKIKIRLQSAKHRAKRRSFREELQEKQEYELNEEVETRLSSRSHWRQNIEKVLDSQIEQLNDLKVSREEAYDFFVKTDWDVSKEGNKKVKDSITSVPKTQPKGEEVIQVEEEEDSRLLVKDMFTTTENWKIYERSKSFFRTRKERIGEEEKLLFIPSNEAMDKLTELQAEEDGLYIEKTKSIISSKNLNKLKNRIISEGLKEKFTDDSQAFIINNVDSQVKYSVLISPDLRSDKELVTKFRPCRLEETFQISSDMKYELIVKVKSLTFTNHPFFSEEHALAQKLNQYFDIYKEIKEKIPIVSQKLQSLFITAKNLNSETFTDEVDVNKCERIQLNKSLLMETYNDRNEKVRKVRNILLQLLSTWDQLQRIRDIQNYAITNVKLVCFEDSDVNINKEKKMWNELVGEGLELEKYLFKENDERAQEEYRRDLRIWKQWQRTKRRKSNKSEIDENIDQMEEEAEPLKPEPPTLSFDETKALDRIRNNTLLIDGRLPGEPKFSKITLETNEINVNLKDLPKSEQRRRNELMRRKYYIQFFVNDQPFGQTNDKESNFNFVIHWNQIFKIDIKNSSSKLRIRINEKHNLSANHLADLFIPLPDGLTNINNSVPLKLEFAFNKNSSDYSKQSIISGFIELMVYWEMDSEGVVLCPPDLALNNKNESELLKNLETLNLDDLKQWIQHLSTQDPNDPNNVNLIETLKNYKELLESNENFQKCFRLDPLIKEFEFVTDEEIENNPRFRLLQNRWQGIPNFKGYRFVPLNEKEIPLSLFEKRVRAETLSESKRGFEDKREKAIKILTKVREQLIRQSQGTFDRPRTLEDMVIEEEVPSISMIGFTLLSAAQNKRPLNPYRRERKKIATNSIGNSEIKIVITIMHALNVPVRSSDTQSNLSNGDSEFPVECKVCPFVEAVFQRESAKTNTAEGPKPTWNETLSLKFKPPENDCLPSNLTKISDCIYLNLFDEVLLNSEENITNEGQKIVHKRTERRWLGSLKIPFSTLYLNCKIEGTFSLSTPSVLLGYEYDTKGWLLGGQTGGHSSSDTSKHTYLTLFVTIDPSLQLPEPLIIKCDTIESESLMLYAKKWQNKLNDEFPERNIKALAININAKSVLVSRYLRSLKPPEEFLTNLNATNEIMKRLARFVSLIPKVPDSIALPGLCDIWCTSDQFLEMLMGDEEEHAILLCNYFLYLGKRASILLGYGIPEGSTAYVIVYEYGQEPHVFNASTGEQFSVKDNYLPLNSIGCIISQENVYANIAKQDHPNRLNYDLNKTSDWRPLFNKNYPTPGITSIQPETLDYGIINYDNALQLQEKLEKHLRESLMRWRKRSRTFFNRHCIQAIRKILPRLEKNAGKIEHNDLIQDLHDILVVHEMTGFPLNMPYTDFSSITEAVFATGVHLAEDKRVEFALAVYIHPYPCSIFSVWVYIAALTRHTQI